MTFIHLFFIFAGMCLAILIAIPVTGMIQRRASRLERKKIEAATPLTLAELRADKDQMRAKFAMSTRRLEISVEELRDRANKQKIEIGKYQSEITALSQEYTKTSKDLIELSKEEAELRKVITLREQEISTLETKVNQLEDDLVISADSMREIKNDLEEAKTETNIKTIELAAKATQVDNLTRQIDHFSSGNSEIDDIVNKQTKQIRDLKNALEREQEKNHKLEERMGRATNLASEREELNITKTEEITELREKLTQAESSVANANIESVRLQQQFTDTESQLNGILEGLSGTYDDDPEKASEVFAKNTFLEGEMKKMQIELQALEATIMSAHETDHIENALLRERLNDLSSEVSRISMDMEAGELDSGIVSTGHHEYFDNIGENKSESQLESRLKAIQSSKPI